MERVYITGSDLKIYQALNVFDFTHILNVSANTLDCIRIVHQEMTEMLNSLHPNCKMGHTAITNLRRVLTVI